MGSIKGGRATVGFPDDLIPDLNRYALFRALNASALSAKFILSGNDGIANENDVLPSALQTAKSPILIISIPIIISTLPGKSSTYTGEYTIPRLYVKKIDAMVKSARTLPPIPEMVLGEPLRTIHGLSRSFKDGFIHVNVAPVIPESP